jgi:hypothetical protein
LKQVLDLLPVRLEGRGDLEGEDEAALAVDDEVELEEVLPPLPPAVPYVEPSYEPSDREAGAINGTDSLLLVSFLE